MTSTGGMEMASVLRRQVRRLLGSRDKGRAPLRDALWLIREKGWNAYLFGGLPRDLLIFGLNARPRDVDIVVDSDSIDAVAELFRDRIRRYTRFGGLCIRADGWRLDVWPLHTTWAFRVFPEITPSASSLPCTTFLNVEAVAVELSPRHQVRDIHTCGFFDAVKSRVIDINFEENPFPNLCVVRALFTAAKLDFSLAPRLVAYIVYHTRRSELEELTEIQRTHYGRVIRDLDELHGWLVLIKDAYRRSKKSPVRLPTAKVQQLSFWESLNWDLAPEASDSEVRQLAVSRRSLNLTGEPSGSH